VHKTAQVLADT